MNTNSELTFKTKPYDHQEKAVTRFLTSPYAGLFLEQGLGKSKILLDIIANQGENCDVLLLAPNGLHANWFYKELPIHFPHSYVAHYWKGMTTKSEEKSFEDLCNNPGQMRFMLMNIEALNTKKGFQCAETFLRDSVNNKRYLVIDESQCIKNHKAQRTKAVFKLKPLSTHRFILTGTPMTQGPIDVFSQVNFLGDILPYRTLTSFKHVFAIERIMTMGQRCFKKIEGYKNLDHLTELLEPTCLRLTKDQCLDLPEKIYTDRVIEMTTEQARCYKAIKEQCLVELESGVTSVTVPIAKITKLHQICTGFLVNDEGVATPLPNNRLEALIALAETTKPLVIFCAFKQNVYDIKKVLEPLGLVSCYTGDENQTKRTQAIEDFQNGVSQFLVGTSAASRGITLTKASTVVYYSLNYSLENYLQSQDRIHRIGQSKVCEYIHFVCPNTIEDKIVQILKNKEELSSMVLDNLIQLIRES